MSEQAPATGDHEAAAADGPLPAEAAAPLSSASLEPLTDLMRRGRAGEADAQIAELIATQQGEAEVQLGNEADAERESDAEAEPESEAAHDGRTTRETILALAIAEPELHAALLALEQWLDGTVDAPSAAPMGAWWALPAAELDLPRVSHEARLYIDSYPKEGLIIGHLLDRCSDWLVRRIAMTFDHAAKLPSMRSAILMLAQATEQGFPTTSASLQMVVADVDDDALWASLVRQVVQAEMQRQP